MIPSKLFAKRGAILVAGALIATVVHGGEQPLPRAVDRLKGTIEFPAKQILAGSGVDKGNLSHATQPNGSALPAAHAVVPPSSDPIGPKVEPGRVRWHPDFAKACEAATKSGKPVLLFHMMGKLDDRFC